VGSHALLSNCFFKADEAERVSTVNISSLPLAVAVATRSGAISPNAYNAWHGKLNRLKRTQCFATLASQVARTKLALMASGPEWSAQPPPHLEYFGDAVIELILAEVFGPVPVAEMTGGLTVVEWVLGSARLLISRLLRMRDLPMARMALPQLT